MKTRWIEITIVIIFLVLISVCFAAWDATKPADSDGIYTWPTSIRANWVSLEGILGVDLAGLGDLVNVKSSLYGAIGDGVADDTTAFVAAFAAGDNIYIPPGTYIINSAITKTSVNDVLIVFAPGAIIDMTGSSDYRGIRLTTGVTGDFSSAALITDVDEQALTLDSTVASSLSVGDIIEIKSTVLWTDNFAGTTKGELREVLAISGNTITLDFPLKDSYTAITTTIKKHYPNTVRVINPTIIRNTANAACLEIFQAKRAIIEGGHCSGTTERCVRLERIFGGEVRNLTALSNIGTPDPGLGTHYGLSISSSQNIRVTGGIFKAGRHGIAIGGDIVSRNIYIEDSVISNFSPDTPTWALDCHAGTDFIYFKNNTVYNGIGTRAKNSWVVDNTVYFNEDDAKAYVSGMIYSYLLHTDGSIHITGNKLILRNTGDLDVIGIRILPGGTNNTLKSAIIARNTITGQVRRAIYISGIHMDATSKIESLKIIHNVVEDASSYSVDSVTAAAIIDHTLIQGNTMSNILDIRHTGDVELVDNWFVANGGSRLSIQNIGSLSVIGNRFTGGWGSGGGLIIGCTYLDFVTLGHNVMDGDTQMLIIGHPRQKILVTGSGLGTMAIQNEAAATAPRHGKWKINDYVIKRDMTANDKFGWACTTAGYGVRGAWAGATAYLIGQQVTNAGKLYRAVTADTSGATPPTHASGEASDDAVMWEFISAAFTSAVFKEFGAIDA